MPIRALADPSSTGSGPGRDEHRRGGRFQAAVRTGRERLAVHLLEQSWTLPDDSGAPALARAEAWLGVTLADRARHAPGGAR